MTTQEKAKAYDEALNKIKPLYEQAKRMIIQFFQPMSIFFLNSRRAMTKE